MTCLLCKSIEENQHCKSFIEKFNNTLSKFIVDQKIKKVDFVDNWDSDLKDLNLCIECFNVLANSSEIDDEKLKKDIKNQLIEFKQKNPNFLNRDGLFLDFLEAITLIVKE